MALQSPIDYMGAFQGVQDPGQALQQAFQQGLARQVAQAQQARALSQQAALDKAKAAAIANPSGATYRALMVLDPASSEGIKRAHDSLDGDQRTASLQDQGALYGYLKANRPTEAKAVLQKRIDADRKAGQDTSDDEAMLGLIDQDPAAATSAVGYHMASAIGPEKFDQAFGAITKAAGDDAKRPGEIALAGAQTAQANATAAKTTVEAGQVPLNDAAERGFKAAQAQRFTDQTRIEGQRLDLDRDTLEANSAEALAKLDASKTTLTPATETLRNGAVIAATGATMLADASANMVTELSSYDGTTAGGALTLMNRGWSAFSGQKSPVQQMRTRAEQLINSDLIKALPPGPASDNDMKTLRKGFPKSTDSRETLISYFQALERTQRRAAAAEQVKADWINTVGSLGNARDAVLVTAPDGKKVAIKQGERFIDYRNRVMGENANGAAAFFGAGAK